MIRLGREKSAYFLLSWPQGHTVELNLDVVTLSTVRYLLITLAVFCSNTVLRKDVREINGDCPPKADATLKPGELKL